MDLIFMRGVLGCFDSGTRMDVLRRVACQLAPNGLLCLARAESPPDLDKTFDRIEFADATFYRVVAQREEPTCSSMNNRS